MQCQSGKPGLFSIWREYNVLEDFKRYGLKYKLYQMKDNLFLWFAFINNKKMRTVHENTKPKTAQTFFCM